MLGPGVAGLGRLALDRIHGTKSADQAGAEIGRPTARGKNRGQFFIPSGLSKASNLLKPQRF
jgi:hypothetical protein